MVLHLVQAVVGVVLTTRPLSPNKPNGTKNICGRLGCYDSLWKVHTRESQQEVPGVLEQTCFLKEVTFLH